MPIYEYECSRCSCRFEIKRSFSENSPVSCPQCGEDAQRLFSPVPIIFKGSGFYCTDNRGNHGHSAPTGDTDEARGGSTDKIKTGKTDKAKTDSKEENS